MSAPADIKPAAPKRPRRGAKPQAVPAAELSAMEIRIALAFRRFKPDVKEIRVETMENIALDHQRQIAEARPAQALRLVVGGAR